MPRARQYPGGAHDSLIPVETTCLSCGDHRDRYITTRATIAMLFGRGAACEECGEKEFSIARADDPKSVKKDQP